MRHSLPVPSRPATSCDVQDPAGDCPDCGGTLDLHQPDESKPERILAICTDCKAWYLIDGASTPSLRLLVPGEIRLDSADD